MFEKKKDSNQLQYIIFEKCVCLFLILYIYLFPTPYLLNKLLWRFWNSSYITIKIYFFTFCSCCFWIVIKKEGREKIFSIVGCVIWNARNKVYFSLVFVLLHRNHIHCCVDSRKNNIYHNIYMEDMNVLYQSHLTHIPNASLSWQWWTTIEV